MTRHDESLRLRHMLDHAREAVTLTEGKNRDDLGRNRMLELALVRLIEVVGEAASRIPQNLQAQLPQIPWPHVIGMRNRLVHGYDKVDLDVLWDTITVDLPRLISQLDEALKRLKRPS